MADAFPVKRQKPRAPSRRRLSAAVARVAQRAVVATEDEIRSYVPTELDVSVAEAMLMGAATVKEIAESLKVTEEAVGKSLRDPIACGWLSRTLHEAVHQRLGLIDAAVLRRALGGDVRAAELAYKRWGEMVERHAHLHLSGQDLQKLSDKELDAVLSAELRRLPSELAEPGAEDPPDPGGPGADTA